VDPGAVRGLSTSVESGVGAALDNAKSRVTQLKAIEHSNFTASTWSFALTYVGAVEFVEEQLKTAREHITEMSSRLTTVAANWEQADHTSDMTGGR